MGTSRRLAPWLSLLLALAAPAAADCPESPLDLAPGTLQDDGPPPTWLVDGDGRIDVADVLTMLRGAVGLHVVTWSPPVSPTCPATPGDVSPGVEDAGTSPPTWTPDGDSSLSVGDVLVSLRLATGLIQLDASASQAVVINGESGDRVVTGKVVAGGGGQGLEGVTVSAASGSGTLRQVETDVEGKFLLQDLPAGSLELSVDGSTSSAAGKFPQAMVHVEVLATGVTSLGSIALPDQTGAPSDTVTTDAEGVAADGVDAGGGDLGVSGPPGSKVQVGDEPAEGEVEVSVAAVGTGDLPEELPSDEFGPEQNATGSGFVGPADGKFDTDTGAPSLLAGDGVPGLDLTLPNQKGFPLGTLVDIWHYRPETGWVNCSDLTGLRGTVVDLGGGLSAVLAEDVVTRGGWYSAAVPGDFSCVTGVSGRVVDQAGLPLPGLQVRTSVGGTTRTDESGNFQFAGLTAHDGLTAFDPQPCTETPFELFVEAGVELSGTTAEFPQAPPYFGFLDLGDLEVSVPDTGCLSGLVARNGVPEAGPVTVSGPTPLVLSANANGEFFATGLLAGEYTASFLFDGELQPRQYTFAIEARRCTAIRLGASEGAGTRRVRVRVLRDDDGDPGTPNPPLPGAEVLLTGTDAVSSAGLRGLTNVDGLAVFDRVSGPFAVAAQVEETIEPPFGSATRRLAGAGLRTTAPAGEATLIVPATEPETPRTGPNISLFGQVLNVPDEGATHESWTYQLIPVGEEDRGFAAAAIAGSLLAPRRDYSANPEAGVPHWFVVKRFAEFGRFLREAAYLGPVTLPAGATDSVRMDLDYAAAQPLLVNRTIDLSYVDQQPLQSGWWLEIRGRGPDGRSLRERLSEGGFDLPAQVTLVDPSAPSAAGWDLLLAVERPLERFGFAGQSCVVALPAPLPSEVVVDLLFPASILTPSDDATLGVEAVDPLTGFYLPSNDGPPGGYDLLRYHSSLFAANELREVVFDYYAPPATSGEPSSIPFTFPPTPQPLGVPGSGVQLYLQALRSDVLTPEFDRLVDFGFEDELRAAREAGSCNSEWDENFQIAE